MGAFLAISYVLCVSYDLLFGAQMYRAWVDLLPGFYWLSWGSFALGLVETIAYGAFFGLVFAPLYNFFLVKVWRHAA
jgi:hypothetical protein